RIVGENLYARHSIGYDDLPSYFLCFSWIIDGEVQSWYLTLARFEELSIVPVSTLYRGPYKPFPLGPIQRGRSILEQAGF
ncbi:RNA ligase family protein, partial [Rhizobium leguminosarum]|uniref:RNA ligase family protein n=1 Tax=Rhizobium leguminosarum TaxID=384 RepID=UPI003F96464A